MAITKLTGFTGEAEVLGRLIRIEFEESRGLLLVGVSQDEAMSALDTLALKKLTAVNPKAVQKEPTKTEEVQAAAALESAKILPDKEVVPESKPQHEFSALKEKAEDIVLGFAQSVAELVQPVETSPVVEEAKPQPVSQGYDFSKAKQLKDVLLMFQDTFGIRDVELMVTKCLELQQEVPVLKRINDIPSRVRRTMELIGQ